MRQETEVPKVNRKFGKAKMFANDKHLPGGFRLLAHPSRTSSAPRAPFVPPSLSRVALPDAR